MKRYLLHFIGWYLLIIFFIFLTAYILEQFIAFPSYVLLTSLMFIQLELNKKIIKLYQQRETIQAPTWRIKFIVVSAVFAAFIQIIPINIYAGLLHHAINNINNIISNLQTPSEIQQALQIKSELLKSLPNSILFISQLPWITLLLLTMVTNFIFNVSIQLFSFRKKAFYKKSTHVSAIQ
ncbi:MAG: hypothetical protein Tsb005_20530 [Gammaproteobacteria bacterium]